ncbi:hypothetical protein [Streptomyces sp. NBC_00658]|uniref:hypothetical protein n=1 Tax=Streptomyces sp. NBC_00658 TaxID=2975800 RepID=UPI00324B29FB
MRTAERVAGQVHFVGSVKWLETQPFSRHEYDALVRDMLTVPGTAPDTSLVAVSRWGVVDDLPLTARWGRKTSYGRGSPDSRGACGTGL